MIESITWQWERDGEWPNEARKDAGLGEMVGQRDDQYKESHRDRMSHQWGRAADDRMREREREREDRSCVWVFCVWV